MGGVRTWGWGWLLWLPLYAVGPVQCLWVGSGGIAEGAPVLHFYRLLAAPMAF